MPHASSDVSSNDEMKVYRVEGEGDDESSAENLKEEKRSLVTEVALKEENRAVDVADRSIPSSDLPHHNQPQQHVGALAGGKHFEYFPSPPFGYVPGYHPHARGPYGALPMVGRIPLVPSNHPPSPLSLMMYSAEQFQPPPAHMGIHINPKTGMPRHSVFPLPPNQFHPPHVFPPDYSQQYSWHHGPVYPVTSGFRSPPYPLALSPLIHPLLPPVTAKPERQTDNQDGRYMCNFSPSSPFSGFSNGAPPPSQQQGPPQPRRAPRSSEKKQSHIKKPLNAFMLFMKEQRPQVVAECTLKESAAINQILGKKWHSLSREEQSKYYEMARSERQMHMQRYPGWTARDNYAINAKKKKRKRDKSQDADGNNPKKCRARFGLDKQSSWCKPCRRKKKCIRYRSGSDNTAGESEDNIGSVGSAQTPDSRYGGEEEGDVSDTDSGNEEDASSEFSLSSPPLRPPSLDRVQTSSQPLGSPPSQQSSHPLNVQLLSQPHLPRAQLSTDLQSPTKTIESHLPLLQKTTESHLQRLSQMADPHLPRSHLNKDPQLPRPHLATDSKLSRPHQTLDPQLLWPHLTMDSKVPRPHQTTNPKLELTHQMTDPNLLHQTTDPKLPQPHQTTDPKLPQLHQTTNPKLPQLHQTIDPKLPVSLLTKDPQLHRTHQTIEPNLPQPRPMTDPQLPQLHLTTELPLMRTPVEAHRTMQPLQGT